MGECAQALGAGSSPLGKLLYRGFNASPRFIVPASFGDKKKLTKAAHQHYIRPFGSWAERAGPWTLGSELTGSDDWVLSLWEKRERLARLPLSLVWGMKDPAFGPSYLDRWREAFPHAQVLRLALAGHFPQEEEPSQVVEAIRASLQA